MIRKRFAVVAATVIAVVVGCAPSAPPKKAAAAPGSESKAPVSMAMKMPRILPSMPAGEVLDLGPVLVPQDGASKSAANVYLLEAADRLGADAFVAENSSLGDVYRIQRARIRTWTDSYGGEHYDSVGYVYSGTLRPGSSAGPPTRDTKYYRAIRYLKLKPTACPIDAELVGKQVAGLMAGDLEFAEQLRILNVLFANGFLDRRAYRKQRARCIEHLDRAEADVAPATAG